MLPVLWESDGPQAKPGLFWPAIDPISSNVWVSDSFDNQYWIFSPDGKYLESWGVAGTGDGQFDFNTHEQNPDAYGAIAFAPDGSFYVLDTGNDRVEKFDKDRRFVRTWGGFGTGDGTFTSPKGIATDGQNVYVADDPRQDIQVFDTNGKFLRSFWFPFVLFTLAPDGHLYSGEWLGNDAAVAEFDTDGTLIREIPVPPGDFLGAEMGQVAVDAAGDIWAPIQNRPLPANRFELIEFGHQGNILDRWSSGGETSVLSPDGKAIYFAYHDPTGNWPFIRKNGLPTP